MRHTDAGYNARGADRARPDADLDRIHAGIHQRLGAVRGGDIAGQHLGLIAQFLDRADGVEHAFAVAVRGIDNDHIDTSRQQRLGTRQAIVTDTRRGGNAQTPLFILGRVGKILRALNIAHRHHADAAILLINNKKLFNAVAVQQPFGLFRVDTLAHRDEIVLGHQIAHRLARIAGETHVAVG